MATRRVQLPATRTSAAKKGAAVAMFFLLSMGVMAGLVPTATAAVMCAPTFAGGATPVAGGTFASTMANGATNALPLAAGAEIVRGSLPGTVSPTEPITVTFPSGTTFSTTPATSHFLVRVFAAGTGGCPSSTGTDLAPSSWRNPTSVTPPSGDPPTVVLTMSGSAWLPTGGTARGTLVVAASSAGSSRIFLPCAPTGAFGLATASDSATGTVNFAAPAGVNVAAAIGTVTTTTGIPADGTASAAVRVHVKDQSLKACVPGVNVRLATSRGAVDVPAPPSPTGTTTDAWGGANFAVSSCLPGATTVHGVAKDLLLKGSASLTFSPPASSCPTLTFASQPQHTAQGLPFVPVLQVRATDASGAPVAGQAVRLGILGDPANVRLVNGPGQDLQPSGGGVTPPPGPNAIPVALTDARGIASFPGLAVVVLDAAFAGATLQLTASSGAADVNSDIFQVGKTSPPWTQMGFNAQRTGWSPNIADFSDPDDRGVMTRLDATTTTSFGDVSTSPVLYDHDGDGVLDLAEATSQPAVSAVVASAGSTIKVWDLSSCAGACTPTTLNVYSAGGNNGLLSVHLAAIKRLGASLSHLFYATVTGHETTPAFDGNLYFSNGASVSSLTDFAGYPFPMGPAVAPIGPGGSPAAVVQTAVNPDSAAATTNVYVIGFPVTGSPSSILSGTYATTTPHGGALAIGDVQPGAGHPEVVSVTAFPGQAGAGGWHSSLVALCALAVGSGACPDTDAIPDTAVLGVSLGDLDGDGVHDIVANGLRSGTWATAEGPSLGQLNVYPGGVPLAPPARLVEGGDLDNTAAIANLADADLDGALRVVNVNDGRPPVVRPSSGDAYSDVGSVMVRDLDGAGAIADHGVWVRPGTSGQPTESPGGGILLTLDPSPAHGYRPDYLFGSRDGTIVATRVIDTTPANPPSEMWTLGGLGSSSGSGQGIPLAPLVAGDVTGDCHAEVFAGLSGGTAGRGEVAVLRGKDAVAPGAPSWTSPLDYDVIPVSAAWTGAAAPDQDTAPGYGFKAKLAWNRPASDGGLPIVAYKVYRTTGLPNDGGPTGAWQEVGFWPSGAPPAFSPYRPFTDLVAAEGDYYYRVAAITCFTLANDPNGDGSLAGDVSAPFYVEVRFGRTSDLRGIPSGMPAFPAPVQANIAWTRDDNYARPHGCEWVDRYRVYKSTTGTGVVAPGNEVTGSPFNSPILAGQAAPATYQYTDLDVVRAGWDGAIDSDGNGAGGLYYYAVNPVNCVGESNVVPNPPYTEPSPNQFLVNTRVPKAPSLAAPTIGTTGVTLSWTPDAIVNGCQGGASGVGGTIMGFEVYRGTSSGSLSLYDTVGPSGGFGAPGQPAPWSSPNPTVEPAPGAVPTTYVDTGIASNTDYYYQVTTVNCVGRSLRSAERSFSVPDLPDAPLGLLALPYGDPAYAGAPGKKVQLSWDAVPASGYGGCTGGVSQYNVQRRVPPAAFAPIASSATTSYLDTTVVAGTSYQYAVTAACTLFESAPSPAVTADVTVPNTPAAPSAAFSSPTTIVVQWSDPGANNGNCNWEQGYRVWRSTNGGPLVQLAVSPVKLPGVLSWPRPAPPSTVPPAASAPTSLTDGAVIFGNTYEYAVAAVNCVGESAQSPLGLATIGNTAPTFVDAGAPPAGVESSTPTVVTVPGWASSIQPGSQPEEAAQGLRFQAVFSSGSAALLTGVTVAPTSLSPSPWTGDLSYTVAADQCGSATYQVTATDDGVMTSGPSPLPPATSVAHLLTVGVACINEPPTFDDAGDPATVSIPAADTPVTIANWAYNISPGPGATEGNQQLHFDLVFDSGTTTIFAAGPAIAPSSDSPAPWAGDITYTLKAGECGTATYHVTATDDGVMSVGPSPVATATSSIHEVTIGVNCANTPPSFTDAGNPAMVLQSATDTPVTVTNWATAISVGTQPGELDQKLVFTLVLTSGTMDIFHVAPTVSPDTLSPGPWSGTLSYTLKPNACGKAAFKVILSDDGVMVPPPNDVPMSSAEHGLVIYVRCPNTPPAFLDLGAPAAVSQAATPTTVTVNNWAYSIAPGVNPEEGSQPLRFVVAPVTVPLGLFTAAGFPTVQQTAFTAAPYTLSPWGRLTYTVAAGACGEALLGVVLEDDGAMNPAPNEPPMASFVHALSIKVDCVNSAPSFTAAQPPSVLEDNNGLGPVTVDNWATSLTPGTQAWESGQKLKFTVTVLTNAAVFATLPTVTNADFASGPFTAAAGWGRLQYTLAQDRCGVATFRVSLADDGSGVAPQVNSFTHPTTFQLNVICVNDAPTFAPQDVVVPSDSGFQSMQWTTPAPARPTAVDEQWGTATQQSLRFTTTVMSTTNGLTFSQPPSVTQTPCTPAFCGGPYTATNGWGRLTFAATAGQAGVAQVQTCLKDSGLVANGGVDETCRTWSLAVVPPSQHNFGGTTDSEDHDQDGIATDADNCAGTPNPSQGGMDGNAQGDPCSEEPAPAPPEPEPEPTPPAKPPADTDRDSIPDIADNCPTMANREQSDIDRDGLGDVCDADIDGDGLSNGGLDGYQDPCPETVAGEACADGRDEPAADGGSRNTPEDPVLATGSPQTSLVALLAAAAGFALILLLLFFLLRRRQDDRTRDR